MLNLERTRERFPILKSKIHLANCSQGAIAQEVIEAIDEYKDTLVSSGMDWERWMEEVRLAKEEFAALIGASSDDVAVFSCVSDAVSAVASCLPIYGRKRIVTTPNEFPTVGQVWLASANRGSIKGLRRLTLKRCSGDASTAFRVTSAPVPAVVGMAITGTAAASAANGTL